TTPLSSATTSFPYTTLFRSRRPADFHPAQSLRRPRGLRRGARHPAPGPPGTIRPRPTWPPPQSPQSQGDQMMRTPATLTLAALRSEEHTSELQSRENLVCRL